MEGLVGSGCGCWRSDGSSDASRVSVFGLWVGEERPGLGIVAGPSYYWWRDVNLVVGGVGGTVTSSAAAVVGGIPRVVEDVVAGFGLSC